LQCRDCGLPAHVLPECDALLECHRALDLAPHDDVVDLFVHAPIEPQRINPTHRIRPHELIEVEPVAVVAGGAEGERRRPAGNRIAIERQGGEDRQGRLGGVAGDEAA
jgi:hypothetical protein